MMYEYALFILSIFFFPMVGIGIVRGRFPKLVRSIRAISMMAFPFLVWDALVTNRWWSFSPIYTVGMRIGPLPIEEVAFFFVIPWACLLLWVNLRVQDRPIAFPLDAVGALGGVILGLVGWFKGWEYTATVGIVLAAVFLASVYYQHYLCRTKTVVFLPLLIGLITIWNGYLTWRPIVLYESIYKSGWMVFTIPFEDYLYGIALLFGMILLYERSYE